MQARLRRILHPHRIGRYRERLAQLDGGRVRWTARAAAGYGAEWARERLEMVEERRLLSVARGDHDVCWAADDEPEPLVTVLIPTYDRGPLIAERAIASALEQTYERLEILVVGDRCSESTAAAVRSVTDPRVRFVDLGARGVYPAEAKDRWMVAGSAPINAGHSLSRGAWIAPCDDDDELTPDHVDVLLHAARSQRVELVHSLARMEVAPGVWEVVGGDELRHGSVSHGTVLYAAPLRVFRFSNTSWKLFEPTDWNLWRRMQAIGVRIGHLPQVTYVHYVEAWQREPATSERAPRQP